MSGGEIEALSHERSVATEVVSSAERLAGGFRGGCDSGGAWWGSVEGGDDGREARNHGSVTSELGGRMFRNGDEMSTKGYI